MQIRDYYSPRRSEATVCEPFAPYLESFAQSLEDAGYSKPAILCKIGAADHLAHWLQHKQIALAELGDDTCQCFLRHLPACRCSMLNHGKSIHHARWAVPQFLEHLRGVGVVAASDLKETNQDHCPELAAFRHWMLQHRGVTGLSLKVYNRVLPALLDTVNNDIDRLNARTLRDFVLQRAKNLSRGSTNNEAHAVRMFLRYLIAEGKSPPGLDAAIPTIANWQLSALPRYLSSPDVERVIKSCDCSTKTGLRDLAIILLLARLGLRSSDVTALRLSDVDWREASIRVSGKGRRAVCLPLTQEVGDAILKYLECGRPNVASDRLFIRARAPLRPFADASAVSAIVSAAIRRSGVSTPFRGSHVLRHSAATGMLRQGVSLQDISIILRHRHLDTTALYAKVDVALLRTIAQPWPEVTPC
jgi:integrase/recombinase XerD